MKFIKLFLFSLIFLISACVDHYDFSEGYNQQVKDNVENIFGVQFPSTQDWCTTLNSSIIVNSYSNKYNFNKVKLVVVDNKDKDNVSINLINECDVKNGESKTLVYDIPNSYSNLYAIFITDKNQYFYKKFNFGDKEVSYNKTSNSRVTRSLSQSYNLPDIELTINGTIESYASKRNWLPGEVFYEFNYQSMNADDYDTDFKDIFRDLIFNYFPNGRKYNNLPKIKTSGYYNESSYPITTGDEPIIVSPVYKNDGGYYEVCFGDLYYYYYKGDNLTREQIEALPKYKAIDLSEVYSNDDNDVISKSKAYALVYFENSALGTVGSYNFPKGYKIGFMYRSKTEINKRTNGQTYTDLTKQGELYCDGRLNYNINNYGSFKSSKLAAEEPRMAWMNIDEKIFLCVESGTDTDYNDLILEVEGGIEPIIIPDEPEQQFYTFCFEDHRLGDYDMNDVVLKGTRLNETQVEYILMATGAHDELYIYNVEGKRIKHNIEVHDIFNKPKASFVNTQTKNAEFIKDTITVDKNFSFLDVTTQPYIYDKNQDWYVKIARQGEDPHAIMIPYDFKWPLEKICIKDAYLRFNEWGQGLIEDTDWYEYPEEDKVFQK